MRSDRDLGLKKEDGELLHLTGDRVQGNPSTSLSGHERNHLFLSAGGEQFLDIGPLSGLDQPGDSRAFAVLDFDRDGLLDVALVNANAPRFQLFENRLDALGAEVPNHVAFRLVGGNRSAGPSDTWSSRDAVGARVELDLGDQRLLREKAAGRGLAALNSGTLVVGIGRRDSARSVTVRWPSGRTTELGEVAAGTLVTVFEDADEAGTDSRPYRLQPEAAAPVAQPKPRFLPAPVADAGTRPKLRVYTSTASWCAACKRELPQTRRLREAFDEAEVEIFGVGIDVADTPADLAAYAAEWEPGYRMLTELDDATRTEFKEHLETTLKSDATPCTVVTDADGHVLATMFSIPTVSEVRKLVPKTAH